MEPVLSPAVAGSYYPSDPQELKTLADSLLTQANQAAEIKGPPRVLIVPHAGWAYSGPTAATAFKTLQGHSYERVIILGSSHQAAFTYVSIYPAGLWETPLGRVEVDQTWANQLASRDPLLVLDAQVQQSEPTLEVELPFLQTVLSNFKIVPILLGQIDRDSEQQLVQSLAALMDSSTLLVVSSDLAHYPSASVAEEVDAQTTGAILTGEVGEFDQAINQALAQGYPNLVTCACGARAIQVGMEVAKQLNLSPWQLLALTHSGEVMGDREQVVGYAALVAAGHPEPEERRVGESVGKLTEEAKMELLGLARQTLESYLLRGETPAVEVKSALAKQPRGAFVTLRTKEGQLRGCIGTFEASQPLWQVVQKMAISAATQDPRFVPVTRQELDSLKIEISVLSPRQRVSSADEIVLDRDGVWVERDGRSGVFLPQVATETGWTKEEFLSQLCSQKAGLPANCWQDRDTILYTFEAEEFGE